MKRGKDIKNTWSTLVGAKIKEIPKGYSNATQIAKKCNFSTASARYKLKALREAGKIDAILLVNEHGQDTWYYKD